MHINDLFEKKKTQAQRSKEKCWPGKHKEGTKPSPTHPGIRVNNCVPNEGVEESWLSKAKDIATTWYLKKDGDVLRTVNGEPFTFKSKEDAVKWAMNQYKTTYDKQRIYATPNPEKNLSPTTGKLASRVGVAEATGDNKFDSMMGKISGDPWTKIFSNPNFDENIEAFCDRPLSKFEQKMSQMDIEVSEDGDTLNPLWLKYYIPFSTKMAQKFISQHKLNPNDPDLVMKVRHFIDWQANEGEPAGLLSGNKLPLDTVKVDDPRWDDAMDQMRPGMDKIFPDGNKREPDPRKLDPGSMEEATLHTKYTRNRFKSLKKRKSGILENDKEQGVDEGWSEKYKRSINCSHPKGFSQKAHCAGKKKHNESAEKECPPATQDITLNLKNRQKAIDEYGYGPLNPDMPNNKFWMKKVDEWDLDSVDEAKQSLCGNCAAFDQRQHTLDCIAQGIDSNNPSDAEATIDAGDLGYCKFLKFKCASRRTCDAWVTGGPLTDTNEVAVPEAAKKGLYYYVNKRKKAGTSRSKDNPKAPTAQAWKDAAKTAKKESVSETAAPWAGKAVIVYDAKGNMLDTLDINTAARKYGLNPQDIKDQLKVQSYTKLQGAKGSFTVGRPMAPTALDAEPSFFEGSYDLYQRHQELRKQSGLPDPSYYKKLGAQKKAEIEQLKKEIEAIRSMPKPASMKEDDWHNGSNAWSSDQNQWSGGGSTPMAEVAAGWTMDPEGIEKIHKWNDTETGTDVRVYQGYKIKFTNDGTLIYKGGELVYTRPGDFSNPTNKDITTAKSIITQLINKQKNAKEGVAEVVTQYGSGQHSDDSSSAIPGSSMYEDKKLQRLMKIRLAEMKQEGYFDE